MNFISRYFKKHIQKKVASFISPRSRVLELACEDASLVEFLRPQIQYTGVEKNKHIIDLNKMVFHQHDFFCFDYLSGIFPFDSDSFDAIILNGAMHLEDNPRIMLSEIKRVMKVQGRFFIIMSSLRTNKENIRNSAGASGLEIEHYDQAWLNPYRMVILKGGSSIE